MDGEHRGAAGIGTLRRPKPGARPYTKLHKGGTVWAKGQTIDDVPTGYWEWFRKDGTLLRSGHFRDGVQVGAWTTYDRTGAPHKVTDMKDGKAGAKGTTVD